MRALRIRPEPVPFLGSRISTHGLLARISALTLLFAGELVLISVLLDNASLDRSTGLVTLIRDWGPWILRLIVGSCAIFLTFLWLKSPASLSALSAELEKIPLGWPWLALHAAAMWGFAVLSSRLYSGISGDQNLIAGAWLAAGLAGILLAAIAVMPWSYWIRLIASGGPLWIYSLASAVAACCAGMWSRSLWMPASKLTFTISKWILTPILSGLIVNSSLPALGTSRFRVIVAPECSGLEGAGLILAFGIVWLLLFRRECRFPQSLLLIPASVVVLFLLNSVRIAALVLIGDAGAKQIAVGGFHSQAGWILFNAVAAGFCLVVRRVPFFTLPASGDAQDLHVPVEHENPTAAYLVPFLAILAAGMIATSASGGFEWLYPLRLLAAATALWIFRDRYASLRWRPSLLAAALGAAVFLIWIALDRATGREASSMPAALAAAPPSARAFWIVARIVAAVATVPLAEELAFRGYLMRRFVSADFESVSFAQVTWIPVLASSILFGVLHGGQATAGTVAGVVFALAVKRKGSMGDAVAAHATANALLAAYVLIYGQWQLW